MRFLVGILSIILLGCDSPGNKNKTDADSLNDSITPTGTTEFVIHDELEKLSKEQIPTEIKFKGTLVEAWSWRDKLGDNILITSEVEPYDEINKNEVGDDVSAAELYAFHFLKRDSIYTLHWKIADAIRSCPFDAICQFLKNSITITDLNNNGIAEVLVQYKIVCISDVSPANKKLIMYEDTIKYSLRGMMCDPGTPIICVTDKDLNLEKVPPGKDEWEEYTRLFGRYENEKGFANAPPAFLVHARSEWLKHIKETFD